MLVLRSQTALEHRIFSVNTAQEQQWLSMSPSIFSVDTISPNLPRILPRPAQRSKPLHTRVLATIGTTVLTFQRLHHEHFTLSATSSSFLCNFRSHDKGEIDRIPLTEWCVRIYAYLWRSDPIIRGSISAQDYFKCITTKKKLLFSKICNLYLWWDTFIRLGNDIWLY